MPRDYLREASSIIFGDKISLASLVETEPANVVEELFRVIDTADGMMGPTFRKAAVYALGQIGDSQTLERLQGYLAGEPATGVQDAMIASMTAIKLGFEGSGYSQLDRRQIIEDVYDHRRRADFS